MSKSHGLRHSEAVMAGLARSKLTAPKLTPALIRAMIAVRAGKVTQVYHKNGNLFRGPRYSSPSTYRRLETLRFIEDVPGQRESGVYATNIKQQLSALGLEALEKAEGHS